MKTQVLGQALLASLPLAAALPVVLERSIPTTGTAHYNLAISQDFADPSIYKSGNTWYAFASNNHKSLGNSSAVGSGSLINTQVATSTDFNTWTVTGKDALPSVGAWANPNAGIQGAAVWAPSVTQNSAGQYVMYYSAATTTNSALHCFGAATATSPQGPYTPQSTPIACPLSQGGAIDSSAFKDVDGTYYVVYKIDGNSIGHGGSCGNTVAPIQSTQIMLQKLASDAISPVGSPIQLLDRQAADGPLIEGPSLLRSSAGKYVLFFSSNCFSTSLYDLSYAFSETSVTGPYAKRGPMLETNSVLFGPGGGEAAADGAHFVFHSGNVGPNNNWPRAMYTMQVSVDNTHEIVNS